MVEALSCQGRRDRPKPPSANEARRVVTAFVHDDPLEPTFPRGRRIVAAALSCGAIAGWLGLRYGAEAPVDPGARYPDYRSGAGYPGLPPPITTPSRPSHCPPTPQGHPRRQCPSSESTTPSTPTWSNLGWVQPLLRPPHGESLAGRPFQSRPECAPARAPRKAPMFDCRSILLTFSVEACSDPAVATVNTEHPATVTSDANNAVVLAGITLAMTDSVSDPRDAACE